MINKKGGSLISLLSGFVLFCFNEGCCEQYSQGRAVLMEGEGERAALNRALRPALSAAWAPGPRLGPRCPYEPLRLC